MKFTLKNIMNMNLKDLNALSASEVREVARVVFKSANKRIANLKSSDLGKLSPTLTTRKRQSRAETRSVRLSAKKSYKRALERLKTRDLSTKERKAQREKLKEQYEKRSKFKADEKFSTKGRSRNKNIENINRARELLSNELSTSKGMRKYSEMLEMRTGVNFKGSQLKRFWKLYNQIDVHEIERNGRRNNSTQVQELIAKMVTSSKYTRNDDILESASALADSLYREQIREREEWENAEDEYEEEFEDMYEDDIFDFEDLF